MTAEPLLEVADLAVSYGAVAALRGVSLAVHAGETVALLGANGAGKTTALRAISGFLAPHAGTIRFAGRAIAGAPPERIVRLGLAHVPEGRRLFPGLTLRENILVGAANRRAGRRAVEADAEQVLALFPELRPHTEARGWTLSGGQQQMVAIARGLMARPRLILLDEPSFGLAPRIVENVFRVLADIAREGIAVLLVEQNARLALTLASRAYVLRQGVVAAAGTAAELAATDAVRAAYLGAPPSAAD